MFKHLIIGFDFDSGFFVLIFHPNNCRVIYPACPDEINLLYF